MSGYWRKLEGQQFNNKYYLKKFKGSGTFGAVFAADEVIADSFIRTVAIKIFMPPDSQLSSDIRNQIVKNWVKELQIAITLKHPSLIDCYTPEEGEIYGDQTLGLVMELADESLEKYLENNTLSPEKIKELIKSVAEGLVFLHDKNIVHRDLKPDNLLRVGNSWKIGDFGVSKQLRDGFTIMTNSMGTQIYAPPEAYDEKATSMAWDVWSLGILTTKLLTNNHPFSFQTLEGLMRKVLDDEPEIPQNIPSPFKEIIEGCLIKERANRWTAKQVLNAIESSTGKMPISHNIKLKTAKADYTRLNQLLADKNWQEADLETTRIMLEIIKPEDGLQDDKWKKFPREDLKIIDDLWVKYSNGHFGFSVQKEIWNSAKIIGNGDNFSRKSRYWRFAKEVGWRVEKNGIKIWLDKDDLFFDLQSPKGHLPWSKGCWYGRDRRIMGGKIYLFSLL